jgi:hypothetical protein
MTFVVALLLCLFIVASDIFTHCQNTLQQRRAGHCQNTLQQRRVQRPRQCTLSDVLGSLGRALANHGPQDRQFTY